MNNTILRADISHAEAIAQAGRRSFYEAFAHLFNDTNELERYLEYTYALKKIEESISKPNNIFSIGLNDNRVIGFAKMKKDSPHKLILSAQQSELQKIYVVKEFHGTGVGQDLMNAVINQSKEIETEYLWLDVEIHNTKAKQFYEKNGFTKAGDHSFVIGTQLFHYDVMTYPVKTK